MYPKPLLFCKTICLEKLKLTRKTILEKNAIECENGESFIKCLDIRSFSPKKTTQKMKSQFKTFRKLDKIELRNKIVLTVFENH